MHACNRCCKPLTCTYELCTCGGDVATSSHQLSITAKEGDNLPVPQKHNKHSLRLCPERREERSLGTSRHSFLLIPIQPDEMLQSVFVFCEKKKMSAFPMVLQYWEGTEGERRMDRWKTDKHQKPCEGSTSTFVHRTEAYNFQRFSIEVFGEGAIHHVTSS